MDVSYRTTLELDKIIARAVQLCTCAETKEMMRAIEPFATTCLLYTSPSPRD